MSLFSEAKHALLEASLRTAVTLEMSRRKRARLDLKLDLFIAESKPSVVTNTSIGLGDYQAIFRVFGMATESEDDATQFISNYYLEQRKNGLIWFHWGQSDQLARRAVEKIRHEIATQTTSGSCPPIKVGNVHRLPWEAREKFSW